MCGWSGRAPEAQSPSSWNQLDGSCFKLEMVWDIDHKLQAEIARPIIFYGRAAGCWQPQVKNVTLHINSIYNNWRFEDVWLER